MPTPVALVTPSAMFEQKVLAALQEPTPGLRRWRDEYERIDPSKVAADVAGDGVAVVCLGPGLSTDALLELAQAFDREHPEMCVLIVAEPTPELWQRAVRAGVRDVISPTAGPEELGAAVRRARETAERRQAKVGRDERPARPPSRIVTVVSPKGGSGKTTVATNLSVGLAAAMPGKVAVVDLDVYFGDVAAALQLAPAQTMCDVAASPGAIDLTTLKVFLTPHPSGLFALCAPESPVEGETVGHEHSARVVRLLGSEFPVVIVDTAAGLDEHALAAIELSTDVVLVCTLDVASVRSLRKEIEALDKLGMTGQRRHFVLNRADARVGLEAADVEAVIGMKADVAVPSSRSVPLSMNQGSPVIESDPRSPVARQLQHLVERFADRTPAVAAAAPAGPRRRRREGR